MEHEEAFFMFHSSCFILRLSIIGRWSNSFKVGNNGFGDHVTFQIKSATGLASGEGSEGAGGGDEGDFELILVDLGEGEGDAVDRDRAFGDEVVRKVMRDLDAEARFLLGGDFLDEGA